MATNDEYLRRLGSSSNVHTKAYISHSSSVQGLGSTSPQNAQKRKSAKAQKASTVFYYG